MKKIFFLGLLVISVFAKAQKSGNWGSNNNTGNQPSNTNFNWQVSRPINMITQTSPQNNWITIAAMMRSYQQGRNISVEQFSQTLSHPFSNLYQNGSSVACEEMEYFADAAQFTRATFTQRNFTLSTVLGLMQSFDSPIAFFYYSDRNNESCKGIVVYGMQGDGTNANTYLLYADPSTGAASNEMSFDRFQQVTLIRNPIPKAYVVESNVGAANNNSNNNSSNNWGNTSSKPPVNNNNNRSNSRNNDGWNSKQVTNDNSSNNNSNSNRGNDDGWNSKQVTNNSSSNNNSNSNRGNDDGWNSKQVTNNNSSNTNSNSNSRNNDGWNSKQVTNDNSSNNQNNNNNSNSRNNDGWNSKQVTNNSSSNNQNNNSNSNSRNDDGWNSKQVTNNSSSSNQNSGWGNGQSTNNSSGSSKGSSGGFSQNSSTGFSLPRQVPIVRQRNSNSCWLACATMMKSYHDNQTYTEQEVANYLGQPFVGYYQQSVNQGLPPEQKNEFIRRMGWRMPNATMNISPGYLRDILQQTQNPIIVTIGVHNRNFTVGFHAVLVVGIFGDGTSAGTTVRYIDPAAGQQLSLSYEDFVLQFYLGLDTDEAAQRARGRFIYY
jgi:Papain-like cysteine protease AvrRpt2